TSFNSSASAEASPSLPFRADLHFQSTACLYSCVTTTLNHSRCRNIKPAFHRLRPSASTSVPTNPGRTNLPQETLGLRRPGIQPGLSLLMSAFSLLNAPPRVPPRLRCIKNAPLPIRSTEIDRLPELRYTVYRQSLSARDRSMSQLLRTV